MSEERPTFNRRCVRPVECLRDGWRLVKDDYWPLLGVTVCGVLLGNLVPFGILLGPMFCGIYLCLLRHEAGRPVSFDMLLKGFDYFVPGLIATLLMMLPALVIVALFYAVFFAGLIAGAATLGAQPQGQPPDLTVVWILVPLYVVAMLALVLVSALLGAFFVFAFPLIVDRGLSGFEAVKLSARAALGNLGGVLGLTLLSLLLGLLGALACYVGAYFLLPIQFGMIVAAYRRVFPADDSVLFAAPPPEWPGPVEPAPEAHQTGIRRPPDGPLSVTGPPDES